MSLGLQVQTKKTDSGDYEVTFASPKAPLDVQELAFTAYGLHNVTSAELGFLRVKVGDGTFDQYSKVQSVVVHDNRDNGGLVVFPSGIGTLVRTSDLVAAHRKKQEYTIPNRQREEVYALIDTALRNSVAVRVGYDRTIVPTNKFGEVALTSILYSCPLFDATGQDYGDYLREHGSTTQSFFFDEEGYTRSQSGIYVNRLRFCGANSTFDVYGRNRNLDLDLSAFGVCLRKIAEGDAKNPPAQQ